MVLRDLLRAALVPTPVWETLGRCKCHHTRAPLLFLRHYFLTRQLLRFQSANEKKGSDGGVGSKTRSGTSPLPVEQTLPPYMRAKARTLDRSRHRRRELPLLVTAPRAPSPDASITTTAAATQHRPPASQRASEGWGENGESVFGPVSKSTVIDIARSGRRSYPASTTKSKGVTIPPKADTEGMILDGGSRDRTAATGDKACVEPPRGTIVVFLPSSESVPPPAWEKKREGAVRRNIEL